jgi:hypothetical protein
MDSEEDLICQETLESESAPTSSLLSDEGCLDDSTDWSFESHFDAEAPRVIDHLLGMEKKTRMAPFASEPMSSSTPGFLNVSHRYQWVHWAIEVRNFPTRANSYPLSFSLSCVFTHN